MDVRVQWRRPEMRSRLDSQAQKDRSASVGLDGVGAALSARVAEGRERILGWELAGKGAKLHNGQASEEKERELSTWKLFKILSLIREGASSKGIAGTRLALTWKVVDAKKTAKARFVAQPPGARI